MPNHVEKGITKMELDTMASTSDFLQQGLTIEYSFHGFIQEQVYTWNTFISYIGKNAPRDSNVEHVPFHLEKKWETTINVQEKKACLEIESIDEFNRNHEAGCSLMMEFDGRQSFNTTSTMDYTSSGCSHEIIIF